MRVRFPEETAQLIDTVFNIAFPVGALITSPLASRLLRRFRKQPHVYLAIALGGQHVFSLFALLPYAGAQAAGALLFGPTRTLLWGSYFHYLAHPRRYPRALAGRTLGYANLFIALASDAPLYALNAFVEWTSEGDSRRRAHIYSSLHIVMEGLLLVCLALPLHLFNVRHRPPTADHAAPAGGERDSAGSVHDYEPPCETRGGGEGASERGGGQK